MSAPGLRIDDLAAGYGGKAVLAGVSFEVGRGEFVGVIGPNGAGKSTLIKAIAATAQTMSGTIEICGTASTELDDRARATRDAVVPQALPQAFSFSAREFVEMGRYPYLGRFESLGDEDHRFVNDALELTHTAQLAGAAVDTLSGGDLQRLTLAQALAQAPSVLLLDEPTSHLDLNHQLQVLDLVRSRMPEGLAVLGVFHDIGLAARYADRIAVISGGRLRAIGSPESVITPEIIRDVFGVRAVVGRDPVTGTIGVTPILREEGAAPTGRGRVLVIGGSGAAASIMRDLVESGFEVTAGALNTGDIDQSVAEALGIEHVQLPPFGEMDQRAEENVRAQAQRADVCVVSAVPFGRANIGNLKAVAEAGRKVVLIDAGTTPVDFADGAATRLLRELGERPTTSVRASVGVVEAVDASIETG